MKKMIKMFAALALAFVFCMIPTVNAFAAEADETKDSGYTYQARSGAQGSNQGDMYGSGYLYIDMRETNRSVNVCVQVVAQTAAEFNQEYYVAWTTPSGKTYAITNVKGNGNKYYFNYHIAEKGTHKFYFLRWDGNTSKFYASARIENS